MNEKTGKQIRNLSQTALRMFMDYAWPGNVRELENAIEHAFVLCNRDTIEPLDLPAEIRRAEPTAVCATPSGTIATMPAPRRKKLSEAALLELLEACDWNKAEVARRAGLSRTAIWKHMKKWGIPLQREEEKEP
jgi:transcriptional regulator of acetoin/glycerol metabolism